MLMSSPLLTKKLFHLEHCIVHWTTNGVHTSRLVSCKNSHLVSQFVLKFLFLKFQFQLRSIAKHLLHVMFFRTMSCTSSSSHMFFSKIFRFESFPYSISTGFNILSLLFCGLYGVVFFLHRSLLSPCVLIIFVLWSSNHMRCAHEDAFFEGLLLRSTEVQRFVVIYI